MKSSVRLLAGLCTPDQRTSYGRNLKNISNDCSIPIAELTKVKVKNLMTYKPVPSNEKWRIKLVDELLGSKFGNLEIPLGTEELEEILNLACSS